MASCARIDNALQAFVDGELNDGERLILEDHVAACEECAQKLRERQRLSATLFEAYSDARLSRPLRGPVLDNLPEIEPLHTAMMGVNERVKNPFRWRQLIAQYAPAGAMALVALLAFALYQTWPEPIAGAGDIGAVTYRQGSVSSSGVGLPDEDSVGLKDFVSRGVNYVTGESGALALSLSGSTVLKADAHTAFSVGDARTVHLDRGRIWLDVGKTGRNFVVSTAEGDVRVMGTIFGVESANGRTRVTVLEGTVHVERGQRVAVVREGYQLDVRRNGRLGQAVRVDAESILAWADAIQPNADAQAFFEASFPERYSPPVVLAEAIFRLDLRAADPNATWSTAKLVVSWDEPLSGGHCGYDVYITNNDNRDSMFKHQIEGSVFDDFRRNQYEIRIPGGTILGAEVLHVRLVPDTTSGESEVDGLEVRVVEYEAAVAGT